MKMKSKRFETPFSASALALSSLAIALPAAAQQAQETPDDLTEVIVTGIRQSLESAQEIKENAEQIVDSVTAQDIGALPDRSVSEALQRIPGVTLQRTNDNRDPARLASEGGGVFIRGLSWVRSETNGRDIFSANNGRGLSFEDVSRRSARWRRRLQESLGRTDRRWHRRHRQSAHASAVRQRQQLIACLGRLQLCGPARKKASCPATRCSAISGNGRRRSRRVVLGEHRQHRQSHGQHPDRPFRAARSDDNGDGTRLDRLRPELLRLASYRLGTEAHGITAALQYAPTDHGHDDVQALVGQGRPERHRAHVRRRRGQLQREQRLVRVRR